MACSGALAKVVCECGCNNPVSVGRRFVVGHNMRGEDLTGRTFGRRKVLGPAPKKYQKENRKWLCRCVCGKESVIKGSNLLSGRAKGCKQCNDASRKKPYEGRYNFLCSMAEGRTTVELSYEEYLSFTETCECHYCDETILWEPYGSFSNGHHLDRKDNSLGYSLENCVVCCPRCNRAKSNHFTYEEWMEIGKVIRSWRMK